METRTGFLVFLGGGRAAIIIAIHHKAAIFCLLIIKLFVSIEISAGSYA